MIFLLWLFCFSPLIIAIIAAIRHWNDEVTPEERNLQNIDAMIGCERFFDNNRR